MKNGGLGSTQIRGEGSLSLSMAMGLNGIASLTGAGNVSNADLLLIIVAVASLTGSGAVAGTANATGNSTSDLTGTGSISNADALLAIAAAAALSGSGDLVANLAGSINAVATLLGSGSLAADIVGKLEALADLAGSGGLTAIINGAGNIGSSLTGSGSMAGAINALAHVIAVLSGVGSVTSQSVAQAGMSADIVVTGSGLSTANVGAAVWAAIAAINNDAGTMGEALNAAGSAGDPWITTLPGSYTAAQAGALIPLLLKLLRNKRVTDPATGIQTIYDDDGTTILMQGNLFEDAAGAQQYRGQGAERAERLV